MMQHYIGNKSIIDSYNLKVNMVLLTNMMLIQLIKYIIILVILCQLKHDFHKTLKSATFWLVAVIPLPNHSNETLLTFYLLCTIITTFSVVF